MLSEIYEVGNIETQTISTEFGSVVMRSSKNILIKFQKLFFEILFTKIFILIKFVQCIFSLHSKLKIVVQWCLKSFKIIKCIEK